MLAARVADPGQLHPLQASGRAREGGALPHAHQQRLGVRKGTGEDRIDQTEAVCICGETSTDSRIPFNPTKIAEVGPSTLPGPLFHDSAHQVVCAKDLQRMKRGEVLWLSRH